MLNFHLDQSGSDLTWNWLGRRWVCGSSWIEPFIHPMLEHFAVTNGRSTLLVVRERQASATAALPLAGRASQVDAVTYEQYLREAGMWPLEFLAIEHHHRDDAFALQAGQWGTAPVYLVEAGPRLRGSWSLADLRGYLSVDRLNELEIARVLTHHDRYSRETLFKGVYRLTERARAMFDRGHGVQITYPAPAAHKKPRPVRPGLDVIGVYEEELERAVTTWPYTPRETAVELSGGMDSANVAVTLAARGDRAVLACALIFGGAIGRQQLRRRREMIEYCGFHDLKVDALDYPPLMAYGARAAGEAISPLAETYHEAVERLLEQTRAHGISTVFTGDGGDELLGLRAAEWASLDKVPGRYNPNQRLPAWLGLRTIELFEHVDSNLAPPSVINPATLLGFASRTPQFMEARMWPLSPLCSPRLIELCEQLPLEWRQGKRLCRERLRRLGFSEDVVNPPLRENFRHVMEYGLAEFGMPLLVKLLKDSILVDHGYVDADELRATHDRIAEGGAMDGNLDLRVPQDRTRCAKHGGVTVFEMRFGTVADRPAAAEMVRSRAAWMRERGMRWSSWDRDADVLAAQVGDPDWPVFVLIKNDQIVGMTTATFDLPHLGWCEDEIAEPSVFLQSTVTDPGFSGIHLGMMIAYWALDYAAANGKQWTRRGVLTIGRDNIGLVHYYRLQGWRVARATRHPRRPEVTVWSLQRPAAPQPELGEVLRWGS